MAVKIISYNVNGIRSAISKGFLDWLSTSNADIVCLQELKAMQEQVPLQEIHALGYEVYWMPAEKKGYSGVAIFSKITPENVNLGCNISLYDCEGRVIRADYTDFSVMSVYMPSGSSGDIRQSFKMQWLEDFSKYVATLKRTIPNLIICGDFNICHRPIDIHNPQGNKNSSGFLPEEREWMSAFLATGFVDTFRHFDQSPDQYSWWSFRAQSRARNKGWRIDYNMASETLKPRLSNAGILQGVKHSDHCPVYLDLL